MTNVKNGDLVRIHYTAKLTDGTVIDSTQEREPLEFQVAAGQIISGLDRQLPTAAGARVGGKGIPELRWLFNPCAPCIGNPRRQSPYSGRNP